MFFVGTALCNTSQPSLLWSVSTAILGRLLGSCHVSPHQTHWWGLELSPISAIPPSMPLSPAAIPSSRPETPVRWEQTEAEPHPCPGHRQREAEPRGPLSAGWVSGSCMVPIQQLPPALVFSLWAGLGFRLCSCALHIRRDFSEKSEISKNKDNWTHFFFYQRECLWLANRHEML